MVLSGARTSLHRSDLSLSPLQIVDQSFFPTIIISHPAIVTVQARTNGAAKQVSLAVLYNCAYIGNSLATLRRFEWRAW
jgi:hypothetical protein